MQITVRESKSHSKLIAWLKLLETINEEMTLLFNSEGISSRTMDASHVEMLKATIPCSLFDEFKVDDGEELSLTFSVIEFRKVLEQFDMKRDNITIMHDEKKAKLVVKAKRTDERVRQFSVNLLEAMDEEVPDPKITYSSKAQLVLEDFREALTAANMYTENVVLQMAEGADPWLRVEGNGDKGDYWDEIHPISSNSKEHSKATFTMSYLMELVKALKPLSESITLNMSTDMPLNIDVGLEAGKLELWLAPCISA